MGKRKRARDSEMVREYFRAHPEDQVWILTKIAALSKPKASRVRGIPVGSSDTSTE